MTRIRLVAGFTAVFLVAAVGRLLLAQHTVQPPNVAEGRRLYLSTCVLCHGPEGRSVPGVSLGSGEFRRARTDDDLVRIVREGIRDTGMPASKLSESEAADILAYLHSMQLAPELESLAGDVARGKALFEGKAECIACHQVRRAGGSASPDVRGPDLSGIGRIRKPNELVRSILDPNAEVLFSYRRFRGTTWAGSTITGRVLNEDVFRVQIVDRDGRLVSLTKSELRHYEFLNQSAMPSYADRLTPTEVADLVAYLGSL